MKLQALRERRATVAQKMRALVDAAGAEERDLNDEEQKEFDALDTEAATLKANIERLEKVGALEEDLDEATPSRAAAVRGHPGRAAPPAKKEFEALGEFISAVRFNPNDQRLANLYHEQINAADTMQMSDGASGGFAVPVQFMSELRSVEAAPAVVRPRATVIPAGSPPDAEVSMPALDQSANQNMYGGVEVSWIEEGGTKPQTDAKLRNVMLKPKEVAAYVRATDKLLRNWQAGGAVIGDLLRRAITASEDYAFLQGNGVGKPLGVLNAGAALSVNRTTADTVVYADLLAMDEKLIIGAMGPVWLVSKAIKTKLRQMQDGAGQYIWQESARPGEPTTLLGYPVVLVDRLPTLGNKGDIMLVDFSHYLIKDGSGIFISASEHVLFTQNQTIIKAFWNVDGQPWMNAPIKREDATTQSPFVVLDVTAASG